MCCYSLCTVSFFKILAIIFYYIIILFVVCILYHQYVVVCRYMHAYVCVCVCMHVACVCRCIHAYFGKAPSYRSKHCAFYGSFNKLHSIHTFAIKVAIIWTLTLRLLMFDSPVASYIVTSVNTIITYSYTLFFLWFFNT